MQIRQLQIKEAQHLMWPVQMGKKIKLSTYVCNKNGSIHSTSQCRCCTVVHVSAFYSQTKQCMMQRFSSSSTRYQTSYSTHAQTSPTSMSKCFQTLNLQSYIHVVQQKQLHFHVLVCHLTSVDRHSAIQGCQRAMSNLLKKV